MYLCLYLGRRSYVFQVSFDSRVIRHLHLLTTFIPSGPLFRGRDNISLPLSWLVMRHVHQQLML